MTTDSTPTSEPILDLPTAVRELGALPMPAGDEPKARTMLDRARAALNARMTKDDLRLVLENTIAFAATLEADREANDREYEAATARVAALESERHTTNEALSEAAEALRRQRDRITALESAPTTVYRASHDSIVMGLYRTREAAQAHCEAAVQQEEPAGSIRHLSWSADDIGDDAEYELHITPAETGGLIRGTGYIVTPLEISDEHDTEADQ